MNLSLVIIVYPQFILPNVVDLSVQELYGSLEDMLRVQGAIRLNFLALVHYQVEVASVLFDVFVRIVHVFGAFISALSTYNHSHFRDYIVELNIIAVYFLLPLERVDLGFDNLLLLGLFTHHSLLLFILVRVKEVDLSLFNLPGSYVLFLGR